MASDSEENPHLVRIKLPFSVVQLWNDLEIGQVVKLPSTDNLDEVVSILAHRDGEESICLEFSKSSKESKEVAANGFTTDITILNVEQTYVDSACQTGPTSVNNKPCDSVTNKKLSKRLASKKQSQESSSSHQAESRNGACIEAGNHSTFAMVKEESKGEKNNPEIEGTMKLPVVISPLNLKSDETSFPLNLKSNATTSSEQNDTSPVAVKRRASEEDSFTSDDSPTPKRMRGSKKYECSLCGAIFIYFTSFIKHMKKHGGPAAVAIIAEYKRQNSAPPAPQVPQNSPQKLSPKLQKILPKPIEPQHHMVTRRNASLSALSPDSKENGIQNLVIQSQPQLVIPRALASSSLAAPIFVTTAPLVVPSVAPLQTQAIVDGHSGMLPGPPCQDQASTISHKPPPNVQQQMDGSYFLRVEDPLDCWVCLRQFKYPTSFMKHMRIEHQLQVKVEEHGERRRRPGIPRKAIVIAPDILTSDTLNNNQETEEDNGFKGHHPGQVLTLQQKSNGDYVVTDSDFNEIVLGECLLCSVCLNSFSYKMEFIKHMSRAHGVLVRDMTDSRGLGVSQTSPIKMDSKVFQCHVCNKSFYDRIPYEQHLKLIHNISMVVMDGCQSPGESFICRLCTMVFLYKTSFEKHMQREHGINASSDQISDEFVDSGLMFRCNLCLAWFRDSNELDDHIISQHPNYSGGRYHNRVVRSPSPDPEPDRVKDPASKLSLIQCDYCSKTFKFRIAYSKHLQNAHRNSRSSSADDRVSPHGDCGQGDREGSPMMDSSTDETNYQLIDEPSLEQSIESNENASGQTAKSPQSVNIDKEIVPSLEHIKATEKATGQNTSSPKSVNTDPLIGQCQENAADNKDKAGHTLSEETCDRERKSQKNHTDDCHTVEAEDEGINIEVEKTSESAESEAKKQVLKGLSNSVDNDEVKVDSSHIGSGCKGEVRPENQDRDEDLVCAKDDLTSSTETCRENCDLNEEQETSNDLNLSEDHNETNEEDAEKSIDELQNIQNNKSSCNKDEQKVPLQSTPQNQIEECHQVEGAKNGLAVNETESLKSEKSKTESETNTAN